MKKQVGLVLVIIALVAYFISAQVSVASGAGGLFNSSSATAQGNSAPLANPDTFARGERVSPQNVAELADLSSTIIDPAVRPVDVQSKAPALAALAENTFPSLEKFAASVKNGDAQQVVGVYAPQVLALKVVQQPASNPAYVSGGAGTATQFGLASQQGTTGLLAHNFLAGAQFFNLSAGQEIDVVYGDGVIRRYTVSRIHHFQALSPSDPYSAFVSLDSGGPQVSSTDLFYQIYGGGNKVVFQTCINAEGNASWGRLFVVATPL